MLALDESATLPPADDTAVLEVPTWFEAPTPWGALRLCTLGAQGRTRHAADAAIALQDFAALLDALDDWSGHDADWRWIEPRACPLTPETHVWVAWEPMDNMGDGPAAARLELPWALLRRLPPPPDALARRLRWPALPSVVVLSRLHLDAKELRTLEIGGALVLPESMRLAWHGLLRAATERAGSNNGIRLALPLPGSPRFVERSAPAPATEPTGSDKGIPCEVHLATARALGADHLAGWCSGELGELDPRASLWCRTSAAEPARCLATGRLMPWAAGWALALDDVAEEVIGEFTAKL